MLVVSNGHGFTYKILQAANANKSAGLILENYSSGTFRIFVSTATAFAQVKWDTEISLSYTKLCRRESKMLNVRLGIIDILDGSFDSKF